MDDAQLEELLGDLSGTERDERRILLEELVANGSGIEELRQAEREGRLEVLPLEHALREEGRETLEATAERNALIRKRWRQRGAPSACPLSAVRRSTASPWTTMQSGCVSRSRPGFRSRPWSRSTG